MRLVQRVSANAIQALKDALTAAFWFMRDLYNFAKAAVGGEPMFLAGIGWTDPDVYKRDSVSAFVDRLVREQNEHQVLLLAPLGDVAAMDGFAQLRRAEDANRRSTRRGKRSLTCARSSSLRSDALLSVGVSASASTPPRSRRPRYARPRGD